jgi:hypothetical protein
VIISEDIKPEKSLHVIGAEIIAIINKQNTGILDMYVLYDQFRAANKEKRISFSYFAYSLVWLNLLNLIEVNQDGNIVKCF